MSMWTRDTDDLLRAYVRWIGRNRWFTYVFGAAVLAFYVVLGALYGWGFLKTLLAFVAIMVLLGVLRALRVRRRRSRG